MILQETGPLILLKKYRSILLSSLSVEAVVYAASLTDSIIAGNLIETEASTYNGGIEIEVDTKDAESRKGLAAAACSALILKCLERGLYPSWDAHHIGSLHLAEKLGYVFSHPYTAYEAGING